MTRMMKSGMCIAMAFGIGGLACERNERGTIGEEQDQELYEEDIDRQQQERQRQQEEQQRQQQQQQLDQDATNAFQRLDENGDGHLSKEEFDGIWNELDADGDHRVTEEEFFGM